MDILVVGDLNIDYLGKVETIPGPDEEVEMISMGAFLGGSGANAAVVAARLGMRVAFYSAVAHDAAGDSALQLLEQAGVDASCVLRVADCQSGMVFGAISKRGLRQLYSYRGANLSLQAEHISDEALAGSRRLHLNGPEYRLAAAMLERSRSMQIPNSLDPGAILLSQHLSEMDALLKNVDILFVNDDEFALLGHGKTLQERAADLLAKGVRWLVVKEGADGATLYRENVPAVHAPAYSIEAVDTTGAGDAFNAAFLTCLVRESPVEDILAIANAVGALASMSMGATDGVPADPLTLQQFMSRTPLSTH